VAVLVDVDRDGRAVPERPASLVARGQRLLAVFDPQLGELRERVERLVERPPFVDVDHERQVGDAANRTHALDVEPVSASELQLEAAIGPRRLLGSPGHVVGVAEPDRPRRGRALPREPEQPERRDPQQLPL
jgi:hypothetical protein